MFLKNYFIQLTKEVFVRFPKRVVRFFGYLAQFVKFRRRNRVKKRMSARFRDAYPCLNDQLKKTPFDQHYTYHPAWAARVLARTKPPEHVDISSILSFSTIVSAFIPIKFYDYRPAHLNIVNYESHFADLKKLPFENDSIVSLSCMHTVEHIGLGRYGDELDADGDLKAIAELKRVLKPGGDLLFVTPVGKPHVEFNGHRIYSFEQIAEYFSPLTLKEFSLIPDAGGLIENADPKLVQQQRYGCGCFWFKK
jgi:SAM-dependent methyltransferase